MIRTNINVKSSNTYIFIGRNLCLWCSEEYSNYIIACGFFTYSITNLHWLSFLISCFLRWMGHFLGLQCPIIFRLCLFFFCLFCLVTISSTSCYTVEVDKLDCLRFILGCMVFHMGCITWLPVPIFLLPLIVGQRYNQHPCRWKLVL